MKLFLYLLAILTGVTAASPSLAADTVARAECGCSQAAVATASNAAAAVAATGARWIVRTAAALRDATLLARPDTRRAFQIDPLGERCQR